MSDIEREEFNQWILDSEYALASPATRRWFFDVWQAARARDAAPVALQKVTYEDGVADLVQMDGKSLVDYVDGTLFYTRPPAANQGVPELNDDLRWILGRPNFACAPMANYLRSQGYEIQHKAEDEQAAVIHWMLEMHSQHGAEWRRKASDLMSRPTPPQPMEDE